MIEWGGVGGTFDPAADHTIELFKCANGGTLYGTAEQLGELVDGDPTQRFCAHAQTGPQITTWMWGRRLGEGGKWSFGAVFPQDLAWILGGDKTLQGVLVSPDYVWP